MAKAGANYVPHALLINAILTIISSFLFSEIVKRIDRQILMIVIILSACTLNLVGAKLHDNNIIAGIIFSALSIGLLYNQIGILLQLHIEEKFTPLESERNFPYIETAEMVGIAASGALLSQFGHVLSIDKFILLSSIISLCIIPFLAYEKYAHREIRIHNHKTIESEKRNILQFNKIDTTFAYIKQNKFLTTLICIVALQIISANIIEFQFVSAIDQTIREGGNAGKAADIMSEIGRMLIIVSIFTLLTHTLLVEKIVKRIGVIGGLIVLPIMTIITSTLTIIRFHLGTVLISKTGFETTKAIFQSSYLTSYYSVNEKERTNIKEFIEGITVPLSAICGTLILIVISTYTANENILSSLILIVGNVICIYLSLKIQTEYMKQSRNLYTSSNEYKDKMEALEIILKNNDQQAMNQIIHTIQNKNELTLTRCKSIEALTHFTDTKIITLLTEILASEKGEILKTAIISLDLYLKNQKKEDVFEFFETFESLQKCYKRKDISIHLRKRIVKIMSSISPHDTISFLVKVIKCSNVNLKKDAIRSIGLYKHKSAINISEEFLMNGNDELKCAAIEALWTKKEDKLKLKTLLHKFLKSSNTALQNSTLHSIGALKLREFIHQVRALNAQGKAYEEKLTTLFLLEDRGIVHEIINTMIEDVDFGGKILDLLTTENLSERFKLNFEEQLQKNVRNIINNTSEFINAKQDAHLINFAAYLHHLIGKEKYMQNTVKYV